MIDIMNTGKVQRIEIDDEGVEFREPIELPEVVIAGSIRVPPRFNMVAMAWTEHDDVEAWWKIMAANPEYLYPPDLERDTGRIMRIPE